MSSVVYYRLLTPLLLLGFVQVILSRFEVKDATKTCLLAEFSANFSVRFENIAKEKVIVLFSLPEDAKESPKSNCNNMTAPLLVVSFENGHSLSLNFSRNKISYKMEELAITLNMSDSALFPNSSKSNLFTSAPLNISAELNTTYTCMSDSLIYMDEVNVTLSKVQWEALPPADDFSKIKTECSADLTPTPSPPPTTMVTTVAPTVTPKIQKPTQGRYNVTNSNGTCLLAAMGLQINITQMTVNKTIIKVFNINPNLTQADGSCSTDHASLKLTDGRTTLIFQFVVNTTVNNFYLKGISISSFVPSQGRFQAENTSLHYLQTTLGKSYMCRAEQVLQVTPVFSINAFDFHMQPFEVKNSKYGIAEECQMDKDDMLIPIIVGAALAGLVLIVLIAYLIGRKRSHAGYQTI